MGRFNASSLRHAPWILGVFACPFLFGSVGSESQALLGGLFALGLLATSRDITAGDARSIPAWLVWTSVALLVLPLVPLPAPVVQVISPARWNWASQFPVEPGGQERFLALSMSPARTINRLWEISIVLAAFFLARRGHTCGRAVAWSVGAAILLESLIEAWPRTGERRTVLGIWPLAWGESAGTFANRNHFANWLVAGALFSFGWLLRSLRMLRISPGGQRVVLRRLDVGFLALCIFAALGTAMGAGSRGAVAAFVAGAAVWAVFLATTRRRNLLAAGAVGMAALLALAANSDTLIQRFGAIRAEGGVLRFELWRQCLPILADFPIFGAGWGAFATVFGLYKTTRGDTTFWHAENDYLQLAVEGGALAIAASAALLFLFIRGLNRDVRSHGWGENSEAHFGALAALAAFSVHALVDFPWQITANAVLAASMLGSVAGANEARFKPKVPVPAGRPRLLIHAAAALCLLAAAVAQGAAFITAERSKSAAAHSERARLLEGSLEVWPWAVQRHLRLLRLQADLLSEEPPEARAATAADIRMRFDHSLARDPLNWELRLERAWFDLAFSTRREVAVQEAWEAVKLNPRQPEIPLRFARHFAGSEPDTALQFLNAVPAITPKHIYACLKLRWQIQRDSAALWAATPDSPAGLEMLGELAFEQNLLPMAAAAFARLNNPDASQRAAARLTRNGRPDLSLQLIPPAGQRDKK